MQKGTSTNDAIPLDGRRCPLKQSNIIVPGIYARSSGEKKRGKENDGHELEWRGTKKGDDRRARRCVCPLPPRYAATEGLKERRVQGQVHRMMHERLGAPRRLLFLEGGKRSGHASGRRVPFSKASSLCSSARVEGILAAGCPVVCSEKRGDVLSWLIVFVETRERVRWPGLYLLISGSVTSRAPRTVGHPACSLIAYL